MTPMVDVQAVRQVSVLAIQSHPLHPRRHLGDLTRLTADIAANGVDVALTLVPGSSGKRHGQCMDCGGSVSRRPAGDLEEHVVAGLACPGGSLPAADDWVLLSGVRRLEAARRAGLSEVPCVTRGDLKSDVDQVLFMLRDERYRLELAESELAECVGALMLVGFTGARVAQHAALPKATVDRWRALLDLPRREWRSVVRREARAAARRCREGAAPPAVE